jgi:Ca2+-binding EF-hand superfamily protein
MVSAEQFLDIFSAKWIEVDSEELQVGVGALRRRPAQPASHAAQLFSFSLYDEDNKGYITKEDLDRWVCPGCGARRGVLLTRPCAEYPPCWARRKARCRSLTKLPATTFPPRIPGLTLLQNVLEEMFLEADADKDGRIRRVGARVRRRRALTARAARRSSCAYCSVTCRRSFK